MKRITEQEYLDARQARDNAEKIINAYGKQEIQNFEKRWDEFESGEKPFIDEELRYSAGARCDECKAGLAYPKDCKPHHWWSCSEELKGKVKGHGTYAFAFYEIKSEDQPSAQGNTTRPFGGSLK